MALSLVYLVLIVLANVFAALWRIPLPFGLMVPAGVFFFAPLFTLRDRIQMDRGVRWIYMLIAIASVITGVTAWLFGNVFLNGMPAELLLRVALASVVAFLFSETLDTVIFTIMKEKVFTQRAIVSNLFSAFVDSLVFIGIAFGVNWRLILGQWIVKMLIAALVIPLVAPKSPYRELPV